MSAVNLAILDTSIYVDNLVRSLERNFRVIVPTEREWSESGRIVSRIADAKHYDVHKIREIHFDVLIALSARRIGATLITRNVGDFGAILQFTKFNLVCW